MSCSRGYWCSDAYPRTDPGCGKHFRSLASFVEHLTARGCLSAAAMTEAGWELVGGFWVSPRDQKARSRVGVSRQRRGAERGKVMAAAAPLRGSEGG